MLALKCAILRKRFTDTATKSHLTLSVLYPPHLISQNPTATENALIYQPVAINLTD